MDGMGIIFMGPAVKFIRGVNNTHLLVALWIFEALPPSRLSFPEPKEEQELKDTGNQVVGWI